MICRIMFNSAFIQNGNYICAGKMQLSPEDIRKDKGKILDRDFKIYRKFIDRNLRPQMLINFSNFRIIYFYLYIPLNLQE